MVTIRRSLEKVIAAIDRMGAVKHS
jgi:hypothetical protein